MHSPLRRLSRSLALLLPILAPGVAHAAWPTDATINVALATPVFAQSNAVCIPAGTGSAIVAWQDFRDGVDLDIYVQRASGAGFAQWFTDGVPLCTAAGDQSMPVMVSDGASGAIIAWQDLRGGSDYDIYVQRVNSFGVPQWTTNGVALCTATGAQSMPAIVADGSGGAIVVWRDYRGGAEFDLYAQRVNASGAPQWTANGVAVCTAAGDQLDPGIASDGAGGAIVAWQDARGGTSNDIYAQRLNAAGAAQWTANGVVLSAAAFNQLSPAIVSDGGNGAVVAWHDYRSGTNADVYAQRVNGAGVPQWTADGVALCTATDEQFGTALVPDGSGGAIVTWQDYRSGTANHIYARRVSGAGAPQWNADGVPICTAAGDQMFPAIGSDGAGGAIVTWQDDRGGANFDIYAQRVNASGATQWTANGVALGSADGDQLHPVVATDATGGAVVAWEDRRSGPTPSYADIYAQNVNPNGSLGGSFVGVPSAASAVPIAFRSVSPNPSAGDLRVSFTLPDATPATLELHDLAGRLILSRPVGELGPGTHETRLGSRAALLPVGVYQLTLTQGAQRTSTRVVIVR